MLILAYSLSHNPVKDSDEFAARSRPIQVAPASPYDRSLSPFEPCDELNLTDEGGRSYEESMRVMYEDPGQRDEKRRLMSLFENDTQQGRDEPGHRGAEWKAKKGLSAGVRRSTRVAGF